MFGPCLNYLSVLIGRLDSADHVHFMEMVNSAGGHDTRFGASCEKISG
jgi:hypothetical protein